MQRITAQSSVEPLTPLAESSFTASALSTEEKLRSENRIQDDPAILAKLGFTGVLPPIPAELIEDCARTSGTVVLKFKTPVLDYQAKLNEALGHYKNQFGLVYRSEHNIPGTTNEDATWINVPNTVRQDTLTLSKTKALTHEPGCQTCDPMETVLMLGYNNLQSRQQMPGFKNRWTFTTQKDTLVGSHEHGGIHVGIYANYDDFGDPHVGMAPRLAPESEKD